MDKKLVYIAGPITQGEMHENIRAAVAIGNIIADAGHAVHLPQVTFLWQLVSPRRWEEWMAMDKIIIAHCDALLRLPGKSKGADLEVELAIDLNVPMFHTLNALMEWLNE